MSCLHSLTAPFDLRLGVFGALVWFGLIWCGVVLVAADVCVCCARADDKMASEYNLEGGATLHLVLALRGGVC